MVGKTTFLEAVLLALYGSNSFAYSESEDMIGVFYSIQILCIIEVEMIKNVVLN